MKNGGAIDVADSDRWMRWQTRDRDADAIVYDLILQFVIASCVLRIARGRTIESHNWNRIANAENQKKGGAI